jgi:hypothetical protein
MGLPVIWCEDALRAFGFGNDDLSCKGKTDG